MFNRFKNGIFAVIVSVALTACGGSSSGGSGDSGGGPQNITFTPLSNNIQPVDEGEEVTVSLNVRGDSTNDLTYDWEVTFEGEEVPFTGGDTDTITFFAPETTGNANTIDIRADMDLSDGILIGAQTQYLTIRVLDLDPIVPSFVIIDPNLPEVDELNLTQLASFSTWGKRVFTTTKSLENGVVLNSERSEVGINYIRNIDGDVDEVYCYQDGWQPIRSLLTNISTSLDTAQTNCSEPNLEVKYYQGDDEFRVVATCENYVAYASGYSKISDEIQSDFGELEIDFDSYSSLEKVTDVCGLTINLKIQEESEVQTTAEYFNVVGIKSTYQGEDIRLAFLYAGGLNNVFDVEFGGPFGNPDFDAFTVFSNQLPTINAIEESENGVFDIDGGLNGVTGEFDIIVTDSNSSLENVVGSFSLSFE